MTSSVDPTAELAAIKARLEALSEECYMGIPQGFELPVDEWGRRVPYRDLEPGSSIPSANGRTIAGGEQAQPYVWAFQIHHVAPSREQSFALSVESDKQLIGWSPSTNAGPIQPFFFTLYDEFVKNSERIQWVTTRFYETELGQNPTL